MITATVSDKGQITLPATIRKKVGLRSKRKVEVVLRDGEIVLRPIMTLTELGGIFHEYARNFTGDWETERNAMEEAIAREVEDECSR